MKHTPEPWTLTKRIESFLSTKWDAFAFFVEGPKDSMCRPCAVFTDGEKNRGLAEANAERIISCINACAGIPDPEVTIPALVEALKNLCEEVSGNVPGYHQAPVVQTAQALLSTINLPTT